MGLSQYGVSSKETPSTGNPITYQLSENPLYTFFCPQSHRPHGYCTFSSEVFLCSRFPNLTAMSVTFDPFLLSNSSLYLYPGVLCSSAGHLQARLVSLTLLSHRLPLQPPLAPQGKGSVATELEQRCLLPGQLVTYWLLVGHLCCLQFLTIMNKGATHTHV